MPGIRRRRFAPGASEEAPEATLARVRGTLDGYLAIARQQKATDADVSVRHVMDLLDPGGTWRLVRQQAQAVSSVPVEDPGGVDPMTGCKSVSAS